MTASYNKALGTRVSYYEGHNYGLKLTTNYPPAYVEKQEPVGNPFLRNHFDINALVSAFGDAYQGIAELELVTTDALDNMDVYAVLYGSEQGTFKMRVLVGTIRHKHILIEGKLDIEHEQ